MQVRRGSESSPSSLLIWYNTHLFWKALENFLVHFVEKSHVPVVTVKLIWLLFFDILFFNFNQTPNKSLRFRKFRRSYAHLSVVVQTNHCQICTAFFAWCALFKVGHIPFFICGCFFSLTIVQVRNQFLLNTPVAQMLLTPRWVSRRKDVKHLFIIIYKLKVGGKHSISRRATFSPNPHLVEEVPYFPFFTHWYCSNWTT